MDHFEKLELRKEITDEVKKDLSLSAFTRLLHGMGMIVLEVFIWVTVIDMAIKETPFDLAYWTCLLLLGVRAFQALMYVWFRNP